MAGQTLYDKLWQDHQVKMRADGTALIYIDRQLLHEVTSPQAFEGLRLANRKPWRISANLATVDHNVPTTDRDKGVEGIEDQVSKIQITTLDENCDEFGILEYKIRDIRQGIVHVIGPEQGATLPGMTVVCGEVEHVLATQCLIQKKMKNMLVRIDGKLGLGVSGKDLVLAVIAKIGTAGGNGYAIEFGGQVMRDMSMEGRMTVCNMAIEAGARAGMVAVDDNTIEYFKGRPYAPTGEMWDQAEVTWRQLVSDEDAQFEGYQRALNYMGLQANMPITDIKLDRIFIGSCTNSRIEDLRMAAEVAKGRKVASSIKQAMVVPGSGLVKAQAEAEGLDQIFIDAGFEWRDPGCSMCLAMNPDKLEAGEHCASTSNRNFEGRQGFGGRTHLVSPAMAAAAAIAGHFVDVRDII